MLRIPREAGGIHTDSSAQTLSTFSVFVNGAIYLFTSVHQPPTRVCILFAYISDNFNFSYKGYFFAQKIGNSSRYGITDIIPELGK